MRATKGAEPRPKRRRRTIRAKKMVEERTKKPKLPHYSLMVSISSFPNHRS
jgi:hypothetical protein